MRRIREELTCKEMSNPQLEKAGWYLCAFDELPLDIFGADAVERWFVGKEAGLWESPIN
ncbi:MAG TPA: hypothetical protein VK206_09620 [Anaerolineales bacterium]|nr:hypothetical protein [Anaerolineales bacterium]HLO30119.1 hypothetical protein [Anaerolineales bacterium]